jgi:hypothetical protein
MKQAADALAKAVRDLGDININLCERPTRYSSAYDHALMPDGTCALDWHTDN